MFKEFLLHVRYPYTAGIIVIIWLGSAILAAKDPRSDITNMLILNALVTTLIAVKGFSSSRR
jgi:hypothetical protein